MAICELLAINSDSDESARYELPHLRNNYCLPFSYQIIPKPFFTGGTMELLDFEHSKLWENSINKSILIKMTWNSVATGYIDHHELWSPFVTMIPNVSAADANASMKWLNPL